MKKQKQSSYHTAEVKVDREHRQLLRETHGDRVLVRVHDGTGDHSLMIHGTLEFRESQRDDMATVISDRGSDVKYIIDRSDILTNFTKEEQK